MDYVIMLIHLLAFLLLLITLLIHQCTTFTQPLNQSMARKKRCTCNDEKYRDMYEYYLEVIKELGDLAPQVTRKFIYSKVGDKFYLSWTSARVIILKQINEHKVNH